MTKKQLELLAQLIDCVSTLQDCLFKVDERLKKLECPSDILKMANELGKKLDNHESEKNGKLVKKSFN
tara:strand:- start:277 stop:480 length:204 start_codon:yes stop_codon:yes gene_type:complete